MSLTRRFEALYGRMLRALLFLSLAAAVPLVSGDVEAASPGGMSEALTPTEEDTLRQYLRACWIPAPSDEHKDTVIELSVTLERNGVVRSVDVNDRSRFLKDKEYRLLAEGAQRSLYKCSPIPLPTNGYARWREMTLMLGVKDFAVPDDVDPNTVANKLFVEAVEYWHKAENASGPEEALRFYERTRLNAAQIVARYPGSDIAVRIVLGDPLGPIDPKRLETRIKELQPDTIRRKRVQEEALLAVLQDTALKHAGVLTTSAFGIFDPRKTEFILQFLNLDLKSRRISAEVKFANEKWPQTFVGTLESDHRLVLQMAGKRAAQWELSLNERGVYEGSGRQDAVLFSVTLDISRALIREKLAAYPIVPGDGLGGVRIGDPVQAMRDALGPPNGRDEIIYKDDGSPLHHLLRYDISSPEADMDLLVFSSPDKRIIRGLRMTLGNWLFAHVDQVNWTTQASRVGAFTVPRLPTINGEITLGSSSYDVRQTLGKPERYRSNEGCGLALKDESFVYQGVSLRVCVVVIDIRIP